MNSVSPYLSRFWVLLYDFISLLLQSESAVPGSFNFQCIFIHAGTCGDIGT